MWTHLRDAPEKVEHLVAARVQCERPAFDDGLTSPLQAQLRALEPGIEKVMRKYIPRLTATVDERDAMRALLARADACRERIEPQLAELGGADEEIAKRFPYHRRETEYGVGRDGQGGGAETKDKAEGAAVDGQRAKRAKADEASDEA